MAARQTNLKQYSYGTHAAPVDLANSPRNTILPERPFGPQCRRDCACIWQNATFPLRCVFDVHKLRYDLAIEPAPPRNPFRDPKR